MASHPRSLSWSADDASTGSSPAFFPVDFERQNSSTAGPGVGIGGGAQQVWMPADESSSNMAHATTANAHSSADDPALSRFGDPRDDLPLLEELGIFPSHILAKSAAVLHPFRVMASETVEDSDIAGPLCFTVFLAFLLTLQGKLHFGAIYGLSVMGILMAHALLTLMSDVNVQLQLVISTLGYCLLPNSILAIFSTFHVWFIGRSPGIMLPLSLVIVAWSAWCATSMFTQAFRLQHAKYLVLYPTTLFYAVFAALTIF